MDEAQESRRSIRQRRKQIIGDFEWLIQREDEEGFRRYLKSFGLVEGTENYRKAFEAWQERLTEKRSRRMRS